MAQGGGDFAATGFNNDNWFENYGPPPTDQRHVLNVSGLVRLPWQFQVSFIVSWHSRPQFSVYVSGVDFNGDGARNDLLPGTSVNEFNRGLSKGDLPQLLDRYNQQFAGKRTAGGQIALTVTLPADYSFNHSFFNQDLRLSRAFALGSETRQLVLFGGIFNLFNIANLTQYDGNIANAASFGRPSAGLPKSSARAAPGSFSSARA